LPNNIINVAVHDLRRTEAGFDIVPGRDELPVNPTTQRVVDDLHELYRRRSSKSHGRFSEDQINYPTQTHLRAYVAGNPPDFPGLTSSLMTTLQVQARRRPNAAGGHVFFAHFECDGRQFLLVAIVNDKLGAALTRDLEVREVRHLDMDGFRFAGRISLSGWAAGEQRYIGFLRGKGDVSEYFKEFLGCDTTVADRQDTLDLVAVIRQFADDQGMEGADKDAFLGRAKAICERSSRNREELEFEAFANELVPNDPVSLLDILSDPDRGLNDRFIPNRQALGSLVKFKARTSLWSVEFEREALRGGNIVYDREANSLTILNLPAALSAELQAETDVDARD